MSPDLTYLPARTTLSCLKPGFHGIEEGAVLALRTFVEETAEKSGQLATSRKVMVVELTAADGTRHHFHTRPEDASRAREGTRQPAPNPFRPEPPRPATHHHSIDAFVEFFHVAMPSGMPRQEPAANPLMDLIQAIVEASTNKAEN